MLNKQEITINEQGNHIEDSNHNKNEALCELQHLCNCAAESSINFLKKNSGYIRACFCHIMLT